MQSSQKSLLPEEVERDTPRKLRTFTYPQKLVIKSRPQKFDLNQLNAASCTDLHTCTLQLTPKLPLITKAKLQDLSLINIIDIIL